MNLKKLKIYFLSDDKFNIINNKAKIKLYLQLKCNVHYCIGHVTVKTVLCSLVSHYKSINTELLDDVSDIKVKGN